MNKINAPEVLKMNRKAVRLTTNKDQPSDYQYWITRPYKERIDAIEMLRLSYMRSLKDFPSRLQRVYRVTQQS